MRIKLWHIGAGGLVALAVWLASGIYFVAPDERGVVRWFGRVPDGLHSVSPGLHYALPWPVTRVDTPRTSEVRRVTIGMTLEQRDAISSGDITALTASPASDMLTGDVNILKVTVIGQYQVADPVAYLFGAVRPDQLVRDTLSAVLIEKLAGMPVDAALTTGKAALQLEVEQTAQAALDRYGCGVQLVSTTLEAIEPPRAIIKAFQDVVSAKKDGERVIDAATAEASRIAARARGKAAQALAEAEGYAQQRVAAARGEAARFESLLAAYRESPAVFRQRLYLQTMEVILPRIKMYVIDEQAGDPPTRVRIMETQPE
jgi:membrane protease subunit HflK